MIVIRRPQNNKELITMDEPFVPTVYSDPEGHRYVNLRPNYGMGVDLLINRRLCYMHEGTCVAIVQWIELENEMLDARIYAPSAKHAASVPSGMTLIKLAELREEGVLTDLRDIVVKSQVYWVADMRPGKEAGHSYFLSCESAPDSPSLIPGGVYVFQEEAPAPVLTYNELMKLVRTPPEASLVLNEPPETLLSSYQLYDQGVRCIIENMTAVQRINDAKEEG